MSKAPEDKRLTDRQKVLLASFAAHLKVLCGLLGLFAFFILAVTEGTEGGLFTGGILTSLWRFSKTAFWLACLWGLFEPWSDYLERFNNR